MRDTADFDEFYVATSRRLAGQLFAMTGDLGEAEDALQQAYIRARLQWPKISTYANPEGWVRSVAFKLCVNAWWKTRNRLTAHRRAAPRAEARSESELGPDLLALVQGMRQLPERQRRVLVLHYVADLTVEQITLETGMPAGTVKSYLSRPCGPGATGFRVQRRGAADPRGTGRGPGCARTWRGRIGEEGLRLCLSRASSGRAESSRGWPSSRSTVRCCRPRSGSEC